MRFNKCVNALAAFVADDNSIQTYNSIFIRLAARLSQYISVERCEKLCATLCNFKILLHRESQRLNLNLSPFDTNTLINKSPYEQKDQLPSIYPPC